MTESFFCHCAATIAADNLKASGKVNVVLISPEIAANTGNIARLCAATCSVLHLVEPLGFRLDDRELKRAGMDYWQQVEWYVHKSWKEFADRVILRGKSPCCWFATAGGKRLYSEPKYHEEDFLVFGRESVGLPEELLRAHEPATIRIPMWNPRARSLNLSNAVAIVLYEALRQVRSGDRS